MSSLNSSIHLIWEIKDHFNIKKSIYLSVLAEKGFYKGEDIRQEKRITLNGSDIETKSKS